MRWLLLSYCGLMILGCGWAGFALAGELRELRRTHATTQQAASALMAEADQAERRLREMEQDQRVGRAGYTPQQAVEMSITVQDAQIACAALMERCNTEQQAADRLAEQIKARQVWFVPLIGWALMHLLGIFYFSSPERRSTGRLRRG